MNNNIVHLTSLYQILCKFNYLGGRIKKAIEGRILMTFNFKIFAFPIILA